MRVDLLVVPGCPHEAPTLAALRQALEEAGIPDTPVHVTVIQTESQAERAGFGGSPTVLVDGVDPFAGPDTRPALACRLYPTPAGPSGTPDPHLLRTLLADPGHSAGL